MSPSSSSNVVVIDVNYGGIFQKNPLMYSLGVVKNIGHVDIQDMEFKDLIEFVEKLTMSKCKRLYYCVPKKSLNDGFRVIKCDLDVYRFLDHVVSNGGRINLYVDHYGEDLTDFIREDNLIDLIVDVDTATTGDIGNESSDSSYQLSNDDDSTSDSTSLDHEHDDDDEDNDVTNLNQTSDDHFLNQTIYDLFLLSQSTTIRIPAFLGDVLPHLARDEVDIGDQMAGQDSQTFDESKYSKFRFGQKMTCSKCKQKGHNRRSCTNLAKDAQPKESTTIRIPAFLGDVLPHLARDEVDIGDQMAGQDSQTFDEV
nr:hypothetical protein CTI12_AA439960 [Tanacetum cinerariifolium]